MIAEQQVSLVPDLADRIAMKHVLSILSWFRVNVVHVLCTCWKEMQQEEPAARWALSFWRALPQGSR
jgi:hypothetical protein